MSDASARQLREFEQDLAGDAGLVASLDGPSPVALVVFGGIHKGVGMPPFEFFRLTREVPVKKIYLRDHQQAWYHRGVRGAGDSVDEVAARIRGLLAGAGVERVVTTGNSAGGYAALLFGRLLGARAVLSFSPQTFLSRRRRALHLDRRWPRQIASAHSAATAEHSYFDLRPLFRHALTTEGNQPPPTFAVHYCPTDRRDESHARQLADRPGVTLHRYPSGGHGLVTWLRDEGRLEPLLLAALGER